MEAAKTSWAFGAGATRAEKGLAYAVSVFGIGALLVGGHGLGWTWWQWLIGILLVHDLAGGVVANGLDTAKCFYHSPLTYTDSAFAHFVHHPVGFTAAHFQPVLIALVIPGGTWWWGLLWYAWALAGAVAVDRSAERLKRPIALGVVVAGIMVAPYVEAPPGLDWLPAVLLLKLVLAHGVPERLGRPVQSYDRAGDRSGDRADE
ncbi:hypothetical protein DCW30_08495 [Streptomyces alfalfae]|uniref:Uncharacterized protein n=1 Tax=Streptomyces alfalfae TaxID=1642299 RepID=A0A1P8TJZ6_9ACTN|nr:MULTISPECIES: hypothetical protein [Streptomyces]AYA18298.1 hypothetical protein D3X13_20515 [Streptomyces fradiae]APY87924.1 hypothetical protein A7J05_21425 [Streptomyces alfalfae]KUL55617.1 hypothetical protein ADL30_13630 [Streptomyces sp. NRRL S-1521]QQC89680.1 hypothetical protein I8755_15550 [Streptomyces alfalfae]QUI32120.1 hypothetical protein H9W91_15535 [Streptomyces alfalfae]